MIMAGWAQANITPIPEFAKKINLHGQWFRRYTTEVHDPLYATVLVLEDSGSLPSIIISADLCFITAGLLEAVREEFKKLESGVPPEAILMCATHTHTGPGLPRHSTWGPLFDVPDTDPDVMKTADYVGFCAKKIAAASAEAWRNRKPGGIALKTGRIAVPQCRRVQYKDGRSVMYGNTNTPDFLRVEGAADNGVEYLLTYDESGKLTGAVINLACPSQIVETKYYISADYWGEVRKQWAKAPYVLPVCGAAGDLTMRDLVRRHRSEADDREWEGVADIAGRIVRESDYILQTVKKEDIKYDIPLKHLKRNIYLPLRTVTEEEYLKAKRNLDALEKEYEDNRLAEDKNIPDAVPLRMEDRGYYAYNSARVERWELQKKNPCVSMELHALRFGDGVLVTNPFELYQEFGNQIKALSPAPYTFIAQQANGSMAYLCNSIAASGGSYSAGVENGFVGPEGGDVLVKKTLDAIETIWD